MTYGRGILLQESTGIMERKMPFIIDFFYFCWALPVALYLMLVFELIRLPYYYQRWKQK